MGGALCGCVCHFMCVCANDFGCGEECMCHTFFFLLVSLKAGNFNCGTGIKVLMVELNNFLFTSMCLYPPI